MHENAVTHGPQVIGRRIERDAVADDRLPFRGKTRQALPKFLTTGHPGRDHIGPEENHRNVVIFRRLLKGALHGKDGYGIADRQAAKQGEPETASTLLAQVVPRIEIEDFPFQETLCPQRRAKQHGKQETGE